MSTPIRRINKNIVSIVTTHRHRLNNAMTAHPSSDEEYGRVNAQEAPPQSLSYRSTLRRQNIGFGVVLLIALATLASVFYSSSGGEM